MGILPKVVLAAIFTFVAMSECSGKNIKILSYNIHDFGNPQYLVDDRNRLTREGQAFVKVIYEYDVIFIQEVKSKHGKAFLTELEKRLNAYGKQKEKMFTLVWPKCFFDHAGNYETYAYFVNTEIKGYAELYPSRRFERSRSGPRTCDGFEGLGREYFVRPPYSLCVKNDANECAFFLLGIHVKPDPNGRKTIEELNGLVHVYEYYQSRSKYGTPNALIMGDLNADGQYIYSAEFELLDLTRFPGGKWIPFTNIPYTNVIEDTTKRPAMYDRFYTTTQVMSNAVVDAKVVNAPAISDHYPIAITINIGNNQAECSRF